MLALDQERLINESLQFWPGPQWQTHVMTFAHSNGATLFWMDNERVLTTPTALSPEQLQGYANPPGFGFISSNLYLWNNSQANRQANAYISALRVDEPCPSLPQIEAIQRSYDDYYQTRNGDINLYGESQMNGEDGSDTNPAAAFRRPIALSFGGSEQLFYGRVHRQRRRQFRHAHQPPAGIAGREAQRAEHHRLARILWQRAGYQFFICHDESAFILRGRAQQW